MNQLQIQNLAFAYSRSKRIFEDFSLELSSGINVLLGANGSGKTTLFKMLATITVPQKGTIRLNQLDYRRDNVRPAISYIPQSFDLFPSLTPLDFLRYIGEVKYGMKGAALEQEVQRVVELADLSEFTTKRMASLSEGMNRRVGIAQALMGDAVLIIADEPTAGLDPEQRENFNQIVRRIPKEKIVLLSTHIIEEIKEFTDHLVVLSKGKASFQGSYEAFVHSLDGRFFQLENPTQAQLEELQQKGRLLGRQIDDLEHRRYRYVLADPDNGPRGGAVQPTLGELWAYYE